MARDKISFDWEYEDVKGLGTIFRPYVPVKLQTHDAGWKQFDFLADTGADVTMLPCGMIEVLGVDIDNCRAREAIGIGGFTVKTWQTTIPVRIKDWELEITATFTSDNLTPLLLGRMDTLDDTFLWIFDRKKKEIIFSR